VCEATIQKTILQLLTARTPGVWFFPLELLNYGLAAANLHLQVIPTSAPCHSTNSPQNVCDENEDSLVMRPRRRYQSLFSRGDRNMNAIRNSHQH